MRAIKLLSYILISFLLVNCGEDFFDSITEVEIPEHESQMVIRANFYAPFGEEYGYPVRLGHTLSVLDTTSFQEIDDATITLYEEGMLKTNFEKLDNGYSHRSDKIVLVEGKNYTIKVNSPTYGNIEATQRLPEKIPIMGATYEADAAVDRYGDRGDEMTIEFQDPRGEKNYYTVSVNATYRFEGPDTSFVIDNYGVYVSPVDPLLEDLNSLYLTDTSFDGETYTTRIRVELMEAGAIEYRGARNLAAEKITARLTSVSKDRYLFQKTLTVFRDNEDNPFAEPVVIHENIEGGTGIFSLSVTGEFPIVL